MLRGGTEAVRSYGRGEMVPDLREFGRWNPQDSETGWGRCGGGKRSQRYLITMGSGWLMVPLTRLRAVSTGSTEELQAGAGLPTIFPDWLELS